MKLNSYLVSALLVILTISCSDKDEKKYEPEIPVIHFQSNVVLRVQDAEGTDLLNRQNTGHYKDSEIEVLEMTNAVSVLECYPETNYYYLQLVLNYPKPNVDKGQHYEEELTTKVKFGSSDADIIKGLYELKYHKEVDEEEFGTGRGYVVILQKAWFNDVEIYELQAAQSSDWESPIIVKEPNE